MAYTVKVTLEDTHPPVWRRLTLPDDTSFEDLHRVLQIVFGWEDDHLHDFTFPGSDLQIIPRGGEPYGDWEYEDRAVALDFLAVCSWIRYTYDFGDDWKHKIVLEKTEETYQGRTAVILKAKGDGFAEDSGGVWGSEERIPFDLTDVNDRLQKYSISKGCGSGKSRKLVRQLETQKMMKNLMASADREKMIKRLEELLGDREMWEEAEEEDYAPEFAVDDSARGRMISDWQDYAAETLGAGKSFTVNLQEPLETMEEVFSESAEETLSLYVEYLGLGDAGDGEGKISAAAKIARHFLENTGSLLYVLTAENYAFLKKLYEMPVHRSFSSDQLEDGEAICRGIVLGLLSIRFGGGSSRRIANLSFTEDAAAVFAALSEAQAEERRKQIDLAREQMMRLVASHGFLEADMLREEFVRLYRSGFEEDEIHRLIYWHLCYMRYVDVLENNGNDYILMPYIDGDDVLAARARYGADKLPQRKLDKKKLFADSGELCDRWEQWKAFRVFLQESYQCDDQETDYWVEEILEEVQDGYGVEELWEGFQDCFELKQQITRNEVWMFFMDIAMDTPLPMLKSHTRREFARLSGKEPWELGLACSEEFAEEADEDFETDEDIETDEDFEADEDFETDEDIEADEDFETDEDFEADEDFEIDEDMEPEAYDVFRLPPQCQYQIYQYMSEEYSKLSGPELIRQAAEKLGKQSDDLLFLQAVACVREQRPGEAEKLLDRLKGRDESVAMLSQMLKKNFSQNFFADMPKEENGEVFMADIVPFRREKAKIGRNDPCPCGSGRKFKKCCMGKGIYD